MIDVAGNVKEEAEDLDEASFDPLKHVKNPSPAVKAAAKDVKRGSYADRAALMKAGGVKDDRGPRGVTQEEVEQIDELKKSTLQTYYKKSVDSGLKAQHRATNSLMGGSDTEHKANVHTIDKRMSGQDAVTKRLGSKETMSMDKEMGVSRLKSPRHKPTKQNPKKYSESVEVEQIGERELSKGETAEKERIVKGMKKSLAGFKSRYGERAKEVMYATATKQAKKD